jgi:mannose-6-phosphate isomerase-like protein (cupin superfamily)
LAPGAQYAGGAPYGPKALLVLQGSATLAAAGRSTSVNRGSIAFAPCGTHYDIETGSEDVVIFQAGLPEAFSQSL